MIILGHPSRGYRAGRECQRNSPTLLGPGPQARYWPPTMNPAERFMVGKEEQGSGVRDTQTWVSRTERTLRRRGYFPSLESSPPAGGISPKTKQRFRRCGGEFLSERSERNQRIAGGIVRKESAAAAPCAFAHDSPGPPFYGRARRARRHLRPARCPQEGYADIIAAALLSN